MELLLASPIAANIVQGFLTSGLIGPDQPAGAVLECLRDPEAVLNAYAREDAGAGWIAAAQRFFGQVVGDLREDGLSRSSLTADGLSDRSTFRAIASFLSAENPGERSAEEVFQGLRRYVVRDLQTDSIFPWAASGRDYGRRRLAADTVGNGLRLRFRDGKTAWFDVRYEDSLLTGPAAERKVAWYRIQNSQGNSEAAASHDPLLPAPSVGELMASRGLRWDEVTHLQDMASLEVSAYASPFYRRFSRPWTVLWNKRTGQAAYDGGALDGIDGPERLYDHFGSRFRREALKTLTRARRAGWEWSSLSFPQYLAWRFPGGRWEKVSPKAAEEAHIYFVRDASGTVRGVLKYFKGRPRDPFAADVTFDQLLALIRGQQALEERGAVGLRYARVYAAGTSWIFREAVPEEGLHLAESDFKILEEWMVRFHEWAEETGDPQFRLMSHALMISLTGDVRGRNVAKAGGEFVIYDPI